MTHSTDWQPIETCPENTWVLVGRSWADPPEHIAIDRFRWVIEIEETVEHESHNAKGRRKTIQEHHKRVQLWESGGTPEWWAPLPSLPSDAECENEK